MSDLDGQSPPLEPGTDWPRRPAEPPAPAVARPRVTPVREARPAHAGEPVIPRPPMLVALAGWLLPGAGYWLIGQRWRAMASGITILLLFVAGVFIGGIRVVDVPGYGEGGVPALTPDGRWTLRAAPMAAVLEKPWYLGQIMAGPVTLVASYASLEAARRQYPKSTAHVETFGTLYVAIAGMLNLLVIIDATGRAAEGNG